MTPQDFNLSRPAYSVNDLLSMLPMGRTGLYAAIKSGSLKATKHGKSTWFLAPDVAAFLNSLRARSAGEA
jgi:hypothetical protein